MRKELQESIEKQRKEIAARKAERIAQEEVVLPNMAVIDSKIFEGIAILHSRVEIEPYLRSGFLYSGNNGHHAIAFYKIPAGITMSDETDPIFTVIGTDLTACLRDAATGLIQTEKKHPKKWEVYTVDVADLERIKEKLKYGTSTKDGIQFSVHRTPLIDIIEQNTPKSESDAQESELEILKKNILERYENTPVNPQ